METATWKFGRRRYIKLYNFSSKVTCSLCYGRVTRVVLPFLMAVHVDERPIYLVAIAPRAGEAEYAGDVDADHDAVLGALRQTQSCGALGLGGGAKRKAAGKRGVRKVPSKSSLRYLSEEGLCGD